MDHDEIIKLCKTKLEAMGWTYAELIKRSGASESTIKRFFAGANVSFYSFQDIIYGLGLEIKIL